MTRTDTATLWSASISKEALPAPQSSFLLQLARAAGEGEASTAPLEHHSHSAHNATGLT